MGALSPQLSRQTEGDTPLCAGTGARPVAEPHRSTQLEPPDNPPTTLHRWSGFF
jgi:hypothetical protein